MRPLSFATTFRFNFGNVFTFRLDAFAQSPFLDVEDRFALGCPEGVSDHPAHQTEFFCELGFLLSTARFSFSGK
jgi:hypothetical protein